MLRSRKVTHLHHNPIISLTYRLDRDQVLQTLQETDTLLPPTEKTYEIDLTNTEVFSWLLESSLVLQTRFLSRVINDFDPVQELLRVT